MHNLHLAEERERERNAFISRLDNQPHKRVDPCFMTGKGCVYTEIIDRELEIRSNKNLYAGFMIIPFQPNINVFFNQCLIRYLDWTYSQADKRISLTRADQIRKTGYVICEKICKKIQDSNFIVADVSVPNPNVFYELGLAYGINQKIIVIYHESSSFGIDISNYLESANCKTYAYKNLEPLSLKDFSLSKHIWYQEPLGTSNEGEPPIVSLLEFICEQREMTSAISHDIHLDFGTHIKSAISVAIDDILARLDKNPDLNPLIAAYRAQIEGLKETHTIDRTDTPFREIRDHIQNSFCVIIRTGEKACHPMTYFWLGYCHALGKNVIPISVLKKARDRIEDLAFDIRALWHMTFIQEAATKLQPELEEILYQMIISDFTEWSRKRFWDRIVGKRGRVSIFTGALHNDEFGREMIGDWDLRAASELTSYFASHQYRATIESPVYQLETIGTSTNKIEYIDELSKMLRNKNCIVIASPEVNPLTETALGKIYGLPQTQWFSLRPEGLKDRPYAIVVVKQKLASDSVVERAFYEEEIIKKEKADLKRGFKSPILSQGKITDKFVSQTANEEEFTVYAHLVLSLNPFGGSDNFVIVLNGVSGPATFALTHVLTGGVSEEFVSYGTDFNPKLESEKILQKVTSHLEDLRKKTSDGLQYILKVTVGSPPKDPQTGEKPHRTFDWRRIKKWELVGPVNKQFNIQI